MGPVAAVAILAAAAASGWSSTGAAAVPAGVKGPRVLGWGFNEPVGVSSEGGDVWVVNTAGDSLTELDAATGALVRVLSASSYGFDDPVAASSDGSHVWSPTTPTAR